jgi:hypothetical protein
MPTRKQRRRRQKDFRHDVRVFEIDEEGNEVPIAELRTQDEKPKAAAAKGQAGSKGKPARGGRAGREVSPPSWERAIKRGGLMGGLMIVVFVFILKGGSLPGRVAIGVLYAAAFIPLTYWIDRTAYRAHLKRQARAAGGGKPSAKKG